MQQRSQSTYCTVLYQEAKYVESWPNTNSAWSGWSRFDIPADRSDRVHSVLLCTVSPLGFLICHQASQQENTYGTKYQKADRASTRCTLWYYTYIHRNRIVSQSQHSAIVCKLCLRKCMGNAVKTHLTLIYMTLCHAFFWKTKEAVWLVVLYFMHCTSTCVSRSPSSNFPNNSFHFLQRQF